MNKILLLIVASIMLLTTVSAIQYCQIDTNCTIYIPLIDQNFAPVGSCSANITINYPDGSINVLNGVTSCGGGKASYLIPAQNLSLLDKYPYSVTFTDGTSWGFTRGAFQVTGNGKEPPTGAVSTFFIVVFLLLLLGISYIIIYSVGHALSLDFDIIDLAWNYGLYFVAIGLLMLETFYLGNPEVHNFLLWVVKIGAVTNMVLPTIYFILTLTVGSWMAKRVKGVDY